MYRNIQENLTGLAFSFLLAIALTTIFGDLTRLNDPLDVTPKAGPGILRNKGDIGPK